MEIAEETHYNTSRTSNGLSVLQKTPQSWAWGNLLVILALRSLRQESRNLGVSLNYSREKSEKGERGCGAMLSGMRPSV